jgi:hypothetical protein
MNLELLIIELIRLYQTSSNLIISFHNAFNLLIHVNSVQACLTLLCFSLSKYIKGNPWQLRDRGSVFIAIPELKKSGGKFRRMIFMTFGQHPSSISS